MNGRQLIRAQNIFHINYFKWQHYDYEFRTILLELIGISDNEIKSELVQTRFNILPHEIRNELQTKIITRKDEKGEMRLCLSPIS